MVPLTQRFLWVFLGFALTATTPSEAKEKGRGGDSDKITKLLAERAQKLRDLARMTQRRFNEGNDSLQNYLRIDAWADEASFESGDSEMSRVEWLEMRVRKLKEREELTWRLVEKGHGFGSTNLTALDAGEVRVLRLEAEVALERARLKSGTPAAPRIAKEKSGAAHASSIRKLMVERRERLREVAQDLKKRVLRGEDCFQRLLIVLEWQRTAELELCETAHERVGRLSLCVKNLKDLEVEVSRIIEMGAVMRLSRLDVDELYVLRLEAEIAMERARAEARPDPTMTGIVIVDLLFGWLAR